MTKKYLPLAICLASLALTASSKADFSFDFNSYTPSPGVNFAPQDGWTLSTPDSEISALFAVSGYGQSALLGGLVGTPTTTAYNLTHSVSEVLANKTLSLDFSVFNRSTITGAEFDNSDPDDTFTINLGGSGGFAYELTIAPGAVEDDTRSISMTGSATTGAIVASDLASLSFYSLSIEFIANGPDLDYIAKIVGSSSATYTGTIAGQAGATLETIGAGWNIDGVGLPEDVYGYNSLVLDNISMAVTVPETSVGALSLLAMGAMGLRRRRR